MVIYHSMKLRVFDNRKTVVIPSFREKFAKFPRKYGIFLAFGHLETVFLAMYFV